VGEALRRGRSPKGRRTPAIGPGPESSIRRRRDFQSAAGLQARHAFGPFVEDPIDPLEKKLLDAGPDSFGGGTLNRQVRPGGWTHGAGLSTGIRAGRKRSCGAARHESRDGNDSHQRCRRSCRLYRSPTVRCDAEFDRSPSRFVQGTRDGLGAIDRPGHLYSPLPDGARSDCEANPG